MKRKADTVEALKLKMVADLTISFTAVIQSLVDALAKMADVMEPIIISMTHDYIDTGKPPYGGRWSRRQMRIR